MAWLRQLLVIASGALTALVAFRAGDHSQGISLLFLRIAWIALGLGILLGAFSLHVEVWSSADLVNRSKKEILDRLSSGDSQLFVVSSNPPKRYIVAEIGCYLSLIVAVVSLVAHAVLRS